MRKKVRLIAYYLPQFHPIPENDKWWGKGFTEWTNVGKAKPLFRGHYQPRIPADLGFYDLRVPETRQAQADMASQYGIEGFCYWHYWFGNGKRLLERPFNEVLKSGKPDFPFCLSWANETWKGFSHGLNNRNILIEQLYPGKKDYEAHFYEVLPAFKDKRYMLIDGKPIFVIYMPLQLPNALSFIELWQNLAILNGLKGVFFIAHIFQFEKIEETFKLGFNAINLNRLFDYDRFYRTSVIKVQIWLQKKLLKIPYHYYYKDVYPTLKGLEDENLNVFPTIIPGWDHSPRSGKEGLVYHNSIPELFEKHINQVLEKIGKKPEERKIVFLKSWNEWAEGNYVEPDLKFGTKYLEAISKTIFI
jgi:hypothetical protein